MRVPHPPLRRSGLRLPYLAALSAALCVSCAAAFGTGPAPADAVVWACGESEKVRPDATPPARTSVWGPADGIRLYGARQEYVACQIVIRAGDGPLRAVELRAGPLRNGAGGELDARSIEMFRQHYLKVTVPSQFDNDEPVPEGGAGEYPVQMVPLRDPKPGRVFDVPARRCQPVWVDLYVPEEQPPGEYRGAVEVLSEGRPVARLDLLLTVWSFTLPRETHLKSYLYTGPENLRWAYGIPRDDEPRLRRLEDRFFQMAHQHRLNFQPSASGDVVEEWGGPYRRFLDGSAFTDRVGRGVGQSLVVAEPGGESREEIQAAMRRLRDWWKRQSFRAALAVYVYDEPHDDEEFAAVRDRAAWIREAVGREIPIFLTTLSPERVPDGLIDIWGEVPAEKIPPRQARGERFWATNQGYAAGPYVDTPGYAGRSQAWMAWRMKLDAWQFWNCCYWLDRQNLTHPDGRKRKLAEVEARVPELLTDTWTDPLTFDEKRNPRKRWWIRLNGDGVLFYPGTPVGLEEPLSSFTMKSLRRGFQDYEYLWLLAQRGGRADDVVDRVVPAPNRWSRDPDAWDEARLELGRRLAAGS